MNRKLKNILSTLIALAVLLSIVLPIWTTQVQAAEEIANVPTNSTTLSQIDAVIDGEYIVTFIDGTPVETMKAIVEEHGGELVDGDYESNLISIKLTNNQYEKLKNHVYIDTVEENQYVHLLSDFPEGELPKIGQLKQYAHEKINVTKALENNIKGKGIEIAILDTGIFPHGDLHIAGGVSTVNYTDEYYDDNGHGTHVAGIIASKDNGIGTTGVASEATIYSVKVQNYIGIGTSMDILEGLDWAIDKGVDIINMSIGLENHSTTLKARIDEAISKGIIVVAAAGNTGDSQILYPAKYDNVIAVGATDQNNNLANFSTRGPEIDIVAPGSQVSSTFLNHHFVQGNGTSQAAPHVSGILALYMEIYPNKTARELTQMLYDNALDLGVTGKDNLFGHGLVQYVESDYVENDKSNNQDSIEENPKDEIENNEEIVHEEEPKEDETKQAERFQDVSPNHWAFDAINFLTEREIIYGYGNGKFGPNDSITRLQAVMMILRAKGITDFSNVENPGFIDVGPGDYGFDIIAKSVELGLIHGKENSRGQFYFDPSGKLTRAEMAVIINNAYDLKVSSSRNFKDIPEKHWAYEAIQALADNKISVGHGNGMYGPNEKMTRAQFSVMLAKLY